MVDKGGFGGLAADFGGWISRTVKENMGQNDLEKMRAAVQVLSCKLLSLLALLVPTYKY